MYLPAGQSDLPGALLVWANEHGLGTQAPLFYSRKHGFDGGLKAISRVQAWTILKAPLNWPTYVYLRCGPLITEPSASRRLLTHTSSATLACARSSAPRATFL